MGGGEFYFYGINMFWIITGDYMKRTDIFTTIFPRVTKCTFHDYSAAGNVNTKDAMCILPFRKHQASRHVRGHSRPQLAFIVSKCGFGDWLILLRLLENLDELVMREIISELRMELRKGGK